MNNIEMAKMIALKADEYGGRAYYAGGYVRDLLLGINSSDIDIEIHGLEKEIVEEIIDSLGGRIEKGKFFGVYGIRGYDIDIALPRKEKAIGKGHQDFEITSDPYIGLKKAAQRRDFTINALMQDIITEEVIDFFNGREDLQKRIIRHVNNEAFSEDPLRVLRAAQFASRFDFTINADTVKLCQNINLSNLSKERVFEEMKKALLKSDKPSAFFTWLREMDQLDIWFPEVKELIGVKQNPYYHSEGDVWNHTMMVLDEGALYREKTDNPLGFMIACLAHDFGKAVCTELKDGRITSIGHEIEGIALAERFINRLTSEKRIKKYVNNLVEYHMKPNQEALADASVKKTNKMFDKAEDSKALIYIAIADSKGMIPQYDYISCEKFLFERLNLFNEYMERPYVEGKDLIKAGLNPKKDFKEALEYAHKLRLAGIEKEDALKQTLSYLKCNRKNPRCKAGSQEGTEKTVIN